MATRLVLLDTYCGGGGAARGYQQAGFEVVGVDIKPQPHYIGEHFIQADALDVLYALSHGDCWPDQCDQPHDWHLEDFVAIHASPPCQAYSRATAWRGNRGDHPDLIGPTQDVLRLTGLPYVLENVQEARHLLSAPFMLCGTMFGLNLQSHRFFERNFPAFALGRCHHTPHNVSRDHGKKYPESMLRASLGCMGMTVHEARQAIPPAYTNCVGVQLRQYLEAR